jgi:hypothetical protein
VTFGAPVTGTYSITVNAGGQYGVGGWPVMQLLVDGVVRGSWTVAVWAPSTSAYSASVYLGAGNHTLALAFTNDAYAPGTQYPDRNLYFYDAIVTAPSTGGFVATNYTCSPAPNGFYIDTTTDGNAWGFDNYGGGGLFKRISESGGIATLGGSNGYLYISSAMLRGASSGSAEINNTGWVSCVPH